MGGALTWLGGYAPQQDPHISGDKDIKDPISSGLVI